MLLLDDDPTTSDFEAIPPGVADDPEDGPPGAPPPLVFMDLALWELSESSLSFVDSSPSFPIPSVGEETSGCCGRVERELRDDNWRGGSGIFIEPPERRRARGPRPNPLGATEDADGPSDGFDGGPAEESESGDPPPPSAETPDPEDLLLEFGGDADTEVDEMDVPALVDVDVDIVAATADIEAAVCPDFFLGRSAAVVAVAVFSSLF